MPGAWNEDFGVEDIEDLLSSQDIDVSREPRRNVIVRVKKQKKKVDDDIKVKSDSLPDLGSSVPGTQTIYIKTWGCTHNTSDSEYMAGLLSSYGYSITDKKYDADLWLLNSCTVKNPAEDHFRNDIEDGRKHDKKLVVAGCVSQGAPKSNYLKDLSIIGVQQIDSVVHVVEQTLLGRSVTILGQKKESGKKKGGAPLSMPKVRKNPLIEIIAISTGCLNHCTYCKTKHARGELGSYHPDEIVSRVKEAFLEGVCEIWLTSEDTGAYGRDIGSSLPELLWRIVSEIPDDCMLRLGMTNPPYILEHVEEMSKILNHPKVYSFLHIPVQSGSDSVLADMKREYCVADFERLVEYLIQRVPNLTIATDLICGFPTETEEDFEDTMKLVRKYRFPTLFINQFYPRPGTPAARMPRVPTQEVKLRTKKVSELFSSYEPYRGLEGTECSVLCTEIATDGKHLVGHNKSYQQVLLKGDKSLLGKQVRVRIISTTKFSMTGEILDSKRIVPSPTERLISTPLTSSFKHFASTVSVLIFILFVRFLWIVFV